MDNIWFAAALAALSRFIRLRKKAKNPDEGIQVHLPEPVKFLIYWLLMWLWCEFIDVVFYTLFGV